MSPSRPAPATPLRIYPSAIRSAKSQKSPHSRALPTPLLPPSHITDGALSTPIPILVPAPPAACSAPTDRSTHLTFLQAPSLSPHHSQGSTRSSPALRGNGQSGIRLP